MKRWTRRPEGSNWGDFGDEDQIGRMNLITPERRRGGIAEATEGLCFALSLPLDYPGWSGVVIGRQPPKLLSQTLEGGHHAYNFEFSEMAPGSHDLMCDDGVLLYTQYSTQWDSLAHWGQKFDVNEDGIDEPVYYNGYRAGEHLQAPEGDKGPYAHRLGIENLAVCGAQGRGVLVDLAPGGDQPAVAIGYDALMRAIDEQRVEVKTGDFLLTWTGYDDVVLSMNRKPDVARLHATGATLDGSDARLLRWIDESGVVAICSDNPGVETVRYSGNASFLPLHELCLFKLGIHLGEMWRLGDLARWLRANGRSAFLITAPPLRLPGSVGSPVTPVATV